MRCLLNLASQRQLLTTLPAKPSPSHMLHSCSPLCVPPDSSSSKHQDPEGGISNMEFELQSRGWIEIKGKG